MAIPITAELIGSRFLPKPHLARGSITPDEVPDEEWEMAELHPQSMNVQPAGTS
ncbi:hypothetical protein [Sphingobium chungbukense]|uniref:hypothetical protein n=1 Tax=Sphingobium chungbukense TaxID=56193 RepID=UPI0012ED2294|nr:hypothetical protein [Sphingobium chungbukense]